MNAYEGNAVELHQVTKRFDRFLAVDRLSFSVPHGSLFGLLGPNGAGKTTTIRMMLNIILPDSGQVLVSGQPVCDGMKNRIGYVPEERGLYPKMTVTDVLLFLAEIKGLARRHARHRVEAWLERMGLTAYHHYRIDELSKGMQHQLQFIAAVVHDPDLLILDEPFTGLDPINATLLKDIMLDLHHQGITIVLSTHQMEQVERLCDRICLIHRGQAVLSGTLAEVKRRYGQRTVALEFDGDRGFLECPDLVRKKSEYGRYVEVQLSEQTDPQALLRAAVASGTVHRFEVMEPSLHEIFIEAVGADERTS